MYVHLAIKVEGSDQIDQPAAAEFSLLPFLLRSSLTSPRIKHVISMSKICMRTLTYSPDMILHSSGESGEATVKPIS